MTKAIGIDNGCGDYSEHIRPGSGDDADDNDDANVCDDGDGDGDGELDDGGGVTRTWLMSAMRTRTSR